MATFVLVHGAWHGSWCWKRVRRALQHSGHDVFTPTLTGVGERAHQLAPSVNLSAHVEDDHNQNRNEKHTKDEHSEQTNAGTEDGGVAEQVPASIRSLVYL